MSYPIRMALQMLGFYWDQDSVDPVESNGRDIPQQSDEELKGKIQELQQGAEKSQGVIETLQEQVGKSDGIIRDLSGRVNAFEMQIAQDRETAAVLNGQIIAQLQKAQEQTATAEETIRTLLGRVNTLEAQITKLQGVQEQMPVVEATTCRWDALEAQIAQDRQAAVAVREQIANGQSGTSLSATSYSEKKEIYLADGRIYNGGWIDESPQGYGEMKFPNGNHYAGYWNNGVYEGQGTLKDGKGNVIYEGEWKDGVYEGQGTLKNVKGYVIYQGEWRQGGRHGKTQHTEGAYECSCTWNCGRLDQVLIQTKAGTCEIDQPPVEEYTENVIEKLKNAPLRGVITWTEGERYEGEFQLHQGFFRPHGKGCKTFNDLRQYDGSWQEGVISGQGVLTTFKEGHSFEGQFSVVRTKFGELTCLEREGYPTTLFFHENGWRYEGSVNEWKRPSGQGKMYIGKDLPYEGVWSSELFKKKNEWALRVDLEESSFSNFQVATILLFPKSNYRYEGIFPKNGRYHYDEQFPINDEAQANFGPHGAGKEYHGETRVYEGGFAEGLYHDAIGVRLSPLKGIKEFLGEFKKGVPDGNGNIHLEAGDLLSGTWSNGDLDLSKVHWRFANGDNFYGSLEIILGYLVAPKSGAFEFANGSVVKSTEWSNGFVEKPLQVQDVTDPLVAYRSGSCSSRP
ncbi:MAG: hypothetical protein JSS61_04150, partial [Verrucomicrobia bacterium]|nr:hypothetical protein [Verrucomicrobiota bacterium]